MECNWSVIYENKILFTGTYFNCCKFRRDNMLENSKLELDANATFNYVKNQQPYVPKLEIIEFS